MGNKDYDYLEKIINAEKEYSLKNEGEFALCFGNYPGANYSKLISLTDGSKLTDKNYADIPWIQYQIAVVIEQQIKSFYQSVE